MEIWSYRKRIQKIQRKKIIENTNKGKSFILAKISNIEIPDGFNITTKRLSIIYPDYEDKNIFF